MYMPTKVPDTADRPRRASTERAAAALFPPTITDPALSTTAISSSHLLDDDVCVCMCVCVCVCVYVCVCVCVCVRIQYTFFHNDRP